MSLIESHCCKQTFSLFRKETAFLRIFASILKSTVQDKTLLICSQAVQNYSTFGLSTRQNLIDPTSGCVGYPQAVLHTDVI